MSQAIQVRTTKEVDLWPKDFEAEFATIADADRVLGKGTYEIIANADGTEYVAPKPKESAKPEKDSK